MTSRQMTYQSINTVLYAHLLFKSTTTEYVVTHALTIYVQSNLLRQYGVTKDHTKIRTPYENIHTVRNVLNYGYSIAEISTQKL